MSDTIEIKYEHFESLNKNVLSLNAEVLRLRQQVHYWEIEAKTDHERWLRVMEENETLRKDVERLRDRYAEATQELSRLRASSFVTAVPAEEYEQMKSENARLKEQYNGIIDTQLDEIARLKAEVERLTSDIQMEKENEDRLVREWQKANNEVYGLKTQVAALIDDQTRLKAECQARQAENSVLAVECDSLKAEVERLTKAGDAMAKIIKGPAHGPGEWDGEWDNWQEAKKGGQS